MEFIMLRGCQKKIYHIRKLNRAYFTEAYLILRNGIPESCGTSNLAEEADRIIHEIYGCCQFKTKHPMLMNRGLAFALGAASSSALIGTIALLITII